MSRESRHPQDSSRRNLRRHRQRQDWRLFFVCSAFLRRRPRFSFRLVSFCFGTVRCGSVLSLVASRAALCSIGAMIDGENVTVTGYMRLPAWPEEPQLVWVLECAKRCLSVLCAARCMLHGVWCGGLRSGCRAVRMLTFNCVANWAIFALCRLLTNDKPQWEIVVHI